MGDTKAIDAMVAVLTDPFGVGHMGITAENLAPSTASPVSSRTSSPRIAAPRRRRHRRRLLQGTDRADHLQDPQGRRRVRHRRASSAGTTMEALAKMKPAFDKAGTVTAGNASGINDGAAFLVLADAAKAAAGGHKAMARLVAYGIAGVPNDVMGEGPIPSTRIALAKAGLKLDEIGVIESNEAFAAQSLTVAKVLGLDPKKTNPNGGAIAIGHPIGAIRRGDHHQGCSTKLIRVGSKYCLATMCIGGGQGITTIWEMI
jgi:acetyl-CoA C-acetyltransferase